VAVPVVVVIVSVVVVIASAFFYMVVVIITMFSIGFTATFAASVSVSVIGMISIFQQI
jgi:hypothetical protein